MSEAFSLFLVPFRSQVLTRFDDVLDLVYLPDFNSISIDFYAVKCLINIFGVISMFVREKERLSPMTNAPTLTEKSKKQRDIIKKTPPKTSITQRLRTDLGRSVGITAVTQLVSLNRFTSAQPSH